MTNQRGRVLLVEGSPVEARLLQQVLAGPGGVRFDVELAERTSTARERLSACGFDAVVLDLSPSGNPSLDSFETLFAAAQGVPIVVLTDPGEEDLALRALRSGARDCLFKRDLPHQELLARGLRRSLENLHQKRELDSQARLLGERDAELAAFRTRPCSGGGCDVFSRTLGRRSLERMRLESELPRALADGNLRLDYQPIVRLDDGVVVGFEALVRWPHPVRGMVPLTELLPVAEEMGMGLRLTSWMVAESCRRFGEWLALRSRPAPELALHVNLSSSCLADPWVVGRLQATLAAHGIPASRLVVEISESLCADCSYTSRVLGEIRALGARVALDDFGTSADSLGYLEKLPVDLIKMDRSYITRLGSRENLEVLGTVLDLADRLGIAVVAEGVETEPQLALLCGLGCGLAQGVLFAGPCEDEEVRALVTGERPWAALIPESGGGQQQWVYS